MTGWAAAFTILVALAGGGGATWFLVRRQARKLGAETTKLEVESAIAFTGAADDRLLDIIKSQTEDIVKPLQEEVGRLRGDVASLRAEVATLSRLWRLALDWIRNVQAWSRFHRDLDPPLPSLPPEIADEL